jgi:hypothetical protein
MAHAVIRWVDGLTMISRFTIVRWCRQSPYRPLSLACFLSDLVSPTSGRTDVSNHLGQRLRDSSWVNTASLARARTVGRQDDMMDHVITFRVFDLRALGELSSGECPPLTGSADRHRRVCVGVVGSRSMELGLIN